VNCPEPSFRGTDSNARYLQHQAKHHGGDPLICPDCDIVISYDNEARHRKTCRERGLMKKEQPLECPFCPARFKYGEYSASYFQGPDISSS
jgi:hypothetical protein